MSHGSMRGWLRRRPLSEHILTSPGVISARASRPASSSTTRGKRQPVVQVLTDMWITFTGIDESLHLDNAAVFRSASKSVVTNALQFVDDAWIEPSSAVAGTDLFHRTGARQQIAVIGRGCDLKAIRIHEFGGPEQLRYEDVDEPSPEAGEVLVRVHACGVARSDLPMRAGLLGEGRYRVRLPLIPGKEVAGEVAEIGLGVTEFRVGDRVSGHHIVCETCRWCRGGQKNLCSKRVTLGVHRPGGYAEYVAIPARALFRIPDGTSYEIAACTKITFGTAWHALITQVRVRAAEMVLVLGAGGGVGNAGVQVATFAGASVIAAVGSERGRECLVQQGLTNVINYSTEDLAARVKELTSGCGVDVVLDTAGGDLVPLALASMTRNGRYVTIGAHAGSQTTVDMLALYRNQWSIIGSLTATPDEYQLVVDLVDHGAFKPIIDRVFRLEDAPGAHQRMAARQHFGNLILVPG